MQNIHRVVAIVSTIVTMLPSVCWSADILCGDTTPLAAKLLSPQQWKAVHEGALGGDVLVNEKLAVFAGAEHNHPLRTAGAVTITWDVAKRLILIGAVRSVRQTNARAVYLIGASGHTYRTTEPALNDVVRVADAVDPCRLFVTIEVE